MRQAQTKLDGSASIPGGDPDDALGCQYLTFLIGNEIYGVNLVNIKEIVELGAITKVPMMMDCVSGVINLRGSVVPVIDVAVRFGFSASVRTKRSSIVIVEIDDGDDRLEMGVIVDEVNEVLDIANADVEPAPPFGTKIRTDFIQGLGKVQSRLLVLLDMDNILSIDELSITLDAA